MYDGSVQTQFRVLHPRKRYFSLLLGVQLMHLTVPFHGYRIPKKKCRKTELYFQTFIYRVSTTEHGQDDCIK